MTTIDDITDAAFRLFATQGYADTSVEDIAAAAGVSRSTFFRTYGSKEAVVFPDHDRLLQRVEERLHASSAESALETVTDAVKVVLSHYVAEGDRARERYRLVSSVPALRERELIGSARYQQLFRRFLSKWSDASPQAELRAELMAAAVVAAHNRVLRRWLRGEAAHPEREVVQALDLVQRMFEEHPAPTGALVVVAEGTPLRDVEAALRGAMVQLGERGPAGAGATSD